MALSRAATLDVSTPTHRPPGRHTASSSEWVLGMSGPVAGRYAAGGRAPSREAVGSCRGSHHPVHPSATT
eukprot:5999687-Pleurochrysis_carterae.AAC.3